MQFELVEPLKQLFKDEVRACGIELGCRRTWYTASHSQVRGLASGASAQLQETDWKQSVNRTAILRRRVEKAGLDKKVWQYFTVVPDFKAVGVRNNARSMGYMVVIRAVNTIDATTASIERIDYDILERICARISAEVPSVSRVCYEITPKPVATIEFE